MSETANSVSPAFLRSIRIGEFHRVAEQIDQNLFQPRRMARQSGGQTRHQPAHKADVFGAGIRKQNAEVALVRLGVAVAVACCSPNSFEYKNSCASTTSTLESRSGKLLMMLSVSGRFVYIPLMAVDQERPEAKQGVTYPLNLQRTI